MSILLITSSCCVYICRNNVNCYGNPIFPTGRVYSPVVSGLVGCYQLLFRCVNTPEYTSSICVWMQPQQRSSQTINIIIFYLWKPPEANRRLPFYISWVCLILDVSVSRREGFCQPRNTNHVLFHSISLYCFGYVRQLTVSSQDVFFILSLGSFEKWHRFFFPLHNKPWRCVCEFWHFLPFMPWE